MLKPWEWCWRRQRQRAQAADNSTELEAGAEVEALLVGRPLGLSCHSRMEGQFLGKLELVFILDTYMARNQDWGGKKAARVQLAAKTGAIEATKLAGSGQLTSPAIRCVLCARLPVCAKCKVCAVLAGGSFHLGCSRPLLTHTDGLNKRKFKEKKKHHKIGK